MERSGSQVIYTEDLKMIRILVLTAMLFHGFGCASDSAPSLSAGVAKANITPNPATYNWVTREPYGTVVDSIYVRALVLNDGQQEIAIFSWDLLNTSEQGVRRMREAIHSATGIPESNILMNASHNHSGPLFPRYGGRGWGRRDSIYVEWAERLPGICADIAGKAQAAARPAVLSVGRSNATEWLFNRMPVSPADTVVTMFRPENPISLPDGLRFGPMDPTLTVLSLHDPEGKAIATVFSVPCHAVSIYRFTGGIASGWPGPACKHITDALGGEALFLQGCAGDIVPARRGLEARKEMARFFANRALDAVERRHALSPARLAVARDTLVLPLKKATRERWGVNSLSTEVQVIQYGPLAVVTLPGEPLIDFSGAIQKRSPFPHTLVIGYSNGGGVGYVGLPGEMDKGGYEARMARGTDESGLFLVETAARLLQELHAAQNLAAEQDTVKSTGGSQ